MERVANTTIRLENRTETNGRLTSSKQELPKKTRRKELDATTVELCNALLNLRNGDILNTNTI